MCATEVVVQKYDEATPRVRINYSSIGNMGRILNMSDNSGLKRSIHLSPLNGQLIDTRKLIEVTATVVDIHNNNASCKFTYEAQSKWDHTHFFHEI